MEYNNIKRNMLWNAAGNIIFLACQWLITILVTNIGEFEDAGLLSLAMSVSAMFQTVALFGIRNYQVSDIENKYSNTSYVSFRTLCCVAAMAGCLIFALIGKYLGGALLAIFLFMLFRLSENFSDVLHGIAQKNDRLDIAGKSYAIKGIGTLALFLLAYKTSGSLNAGLAAMASFSWISTILYDYIVVKKISEFKVFDNIAGSVGLAKETWPLCIYMFASAAMATVPKLILESLLGEEMLGIYSSIFAPALLITSAAGYLYSPFVPAFAELYGNKKHKSFLSLFIKIVLAIASFAVLVIVAAIFLGDFALGILFGEKIAEHTYLLIPILIAIFASATFTFLCILSIVLRDFIFLLISCGAGLILELALTGKWINSAGMNAASYSYIAGCALSGMILLLRMIYILFKKPGLKQ